MEQMRRAVRSHASSLFEERLAAFWWKLRTGKQVRVLTLGGSLTIGQRLCCASVKPWPYFLSHWLRQNFGHAQHIVDNMGRGSMDTIGLEAVWPASPKGYDLVVVETASNDMALAANFHETSEHVKAAIELIVLRIRAKTSAALLLLETFPGGRVERHGFFDTAEIRATWKQNVPIFQDGYVNGDSLHVEVAKYYGVPQVSLGQALFPEYRLWREDSSSGWFENKWIDQCCPPCYDAFHPNAEGQARFAELLTSYLIIFGRGLSPEPPTANLSRERPRPLFVSESRAKAEESAALPLLLDFHVNKGDSHIAFAHGWSYFEDAVGKPGWISMPKSDENSSHLYSRGGQLSGAEVVERHMASHDVNKGNRSCRGVNELGLTFVSGELGSLQVGYLKSHDTAMGVVDFKVKCDRLSGQGQKSTVPLNFDRHLRLDGHHNSPTSVPNYIVVTGLIPRAACNVTFVLKTGPPKFKVLALKAY